MISLLLFTTIINVHFYLISSIDIPSLQKKIQDNSNDIVARIGQHLGWNDNLKMYYEAFEKNLFKDYIQVNNDC